MVIAPESLSIRPYLIRALYEWCTDNSYTPYIAVLADANVQVPREYIKNGEIVLNISFDATSALKLGNDFIEFSARFSGTARQIVVPVGHVIAIYARENGQGMAFPVAADQVVSVSPSLAVVQPQASDANVVQFQSPVNLDADLDSAADTPVSDPPAGGSKRGTRPSLRRVK
jgi:stringent starvation protein B